MDSIKLTGTQIVDTRKMKQSGRYRITLELTEQDTKFNGGTLAVAEINDLLANVELTFTEIQGNNNGHEENTVKETKIEWTRYQQFKKVCLDYSGENYYNRLKNHLAIKHLKDLEVNHDKSMVNDILCLQGSYIESKINKMMWVPIIESLTHKDNAYNLWLELFDNFNNPK